MPQQLSSQLNQILKETSRAFYLSLAILPDYSRKPLSLAYLLARAADTIADSEVSEEAPRVETLSLYQECLSHPERAGELRLSGFTPEHQGEASLLTRVPQLFQELRDCPEHQAQAISSVVHTLVKGMLWDQELFAGGARRNGLTPEQLETYTYLVAGCVGPFWSEVCAWGDQRLSPLLSEPMTEVAIEFGKGLQWVNILRDIPGDQREGRYYLPALEQPEFRTRFEASSRRALRAFQRARIYPLQFPGSRFRDRIALLLPLVLGLRTLEKLFRDGGPRPNRRVKVSRKEVLGWLAVSPLCVVTSAGFDALLNHLLRRAEKALDALDW